ncbi:SLC13 family permease [Nocardioides sp. zg-1228]|uniref:SLC13 family permease n=1 Tax=Nocardioides sp. zg-1228 TaxID=2763008 RepID=UPI001642BDF7|nr:SLC13 family permease [Nocardioides sp. zg-1228]MBC2934686.1 arsenic transporter [Nocardioides sp. zg-1228]QSF56004.1 arsenic transporter [Nocardioides sp. zg-1228]
MSQTLLAALVQVAPIAVFLVAITVTAEVAQLAGVFDVAAHALARRARHRVLLLWLAFAGLAVACTVVLSLDTTAVLLTPVGIAVARQTGIAPLPFALTTLWIANTGSLLLPVSNLTNLLAVHRLADLDAGHGDYVRAAALPALAAVAVTLLLIAVLQRRALRGTYAVEPPADPHDRVLLVVAGGVCLLIGPLFAVGAPPALVALGSAGVLLAVLRWRAPGLVRDVRPPWLMAGAFLVVAGLLRLAQGEGMLDWLAPAFGAGTRTLDLLHLSATAALAANAVNNLPAYLLVEPAASDDVRRLVASLVGVNAGALVTPWASLATLLWLQRCRAAGLRIPLLRLAAWGALCATLSVTAATLAIR